MKHVILSLLLFISPLFSEESLQEQHNRIHHEFIILSNALQGFPEKDSTMDQKKVVLIFDYIDQVLFPHFTWEEQVFYPSASKYLECAQMSFSATFQREHQIMRRWIAELRDLSKQSDASIADFTKLYYQILGLLQGHMETEDVILIPLVEKFGPKK